MVKFSHEVKVSKCTEAVDRVWRGITKTSPIRKTFNRTHSYRNFVFSPSERWGLAVYQTRVILRPKLRKFIPQVIVLDMLTKEETLYESSCLNEVEEITDMYWISENEFVLVSYFFKRMEFTQMYCSLNKKNNKVILLGSTITRVPYQLAIPLFYQFFINNIGVSPLYLNGERYIVLNNMQYLTLVPWNGMYSHASMLRIDLTHEAYHRRLVLGNFFCYGSCIYLPDYILGLSMPCCKVNKLLCIDVSKVQFKDSVAFIARGDPLITTVQFSPLNYTEFSEVDKETRDIGFCARDGIQFRQRGNYVIISEKVYETVLSADNPLTQVQLRDYHVMDLKKKTVSIYKIMANSVDHNVTICGDSLLLVRNSLSSLENDFEYMTVGLIKKKVPSLLDLARRSVICRNLPVDPLYAPHVFPLIHCCDKIYKNAAGEVVECVCDGEKFLDIKENYSLNKM